LVVRNQARTIAYKWLKKGSGRTRFAALIEL